MKGIVITLQSDFRSNECDPSQRSEVSPLASIGGCLFFVWNLVTLSAAFLPQQWSKLVVTEIVWPIIHKFTDSLPASDLNYQCILVVPTTS